MSYLSERQQAQLLRGIRASRISTTREGMSHLEAYDVKAHLNRVFGFARWSADVLDCALLFETLGETTKNNQPWPVVSVAYRVTMRLAVHAPDGTPLATYTEIATGDAVNFPINKRGDAHDFAVKTAESQALKRCAVNLGDQFGLSLYRKGSLEPLVRATLLGEVKEEQKPDGEQAVDADAPPVVPEHVPTYADDTQTPPAASDTAGEPEAPGSPPTAPDLSAPDAAPEPPDLTAEVEQIRSRVIEALQNPSKREAAKILARIGTDAGKLHVLTQPTTSPKGEPMTVNVLLDEANKAVARRDQLHRPEEVPA